MKKQTFTFCFPEKHESINVAVNPLEVKDIAIGLIFKQADVHGKTCIVCAENGDEVGVAILSSNENKVKFFVESEPCYNMKTVTEYI